MNYLFYICSGEGKRRGSDDIGGGRRGRSSGGYLISNLS